MSPRTRYEADIQARAVDALLATSVDVARNHVADLSANAWQALNTDPFSQRTHALRFIARAAAERLDASVGGAR